MSFDLKNWRWGLALRGLLAVFVLSSHAAIAASQIPGPPSGSSRQIFLAVDGFSHAAFVTAQKQGLFAEFKNSGAHIAPFPTMTDLSWATMFKTADLFGAAGRIKNVEATFFDDSTQSVQGDPRDYYQRLAYPKYFLGGFEAIFNPYIEALVYFPTEEVPKMEVKSVIDQVLASRGKGTIAGYIGSVDSTAHTQRNRLFPVLRVLDSEIKRLLKTFKDRGENVEVIMVSDHGNIGRFAEGGAEQELQPVEISKLIDAAGFRFVSQLKEPKDIAMPLLALGSWGPVYFKDRKNRLPLIESLRGQNWFDLALFINKKHRRETLMTVISKDGEAQIRFDIEKSLYTYIPSRGNPLQIDPRFYRKELTEAEARKVSLGTAYPDALFRLIASSTDKDFDFPDLIVTLKDGFFIQNALGGFTKMYRTHGALSRASSEGLVASTRRPIPAEIRAQDILSFFEIDPRTLFGERYRTHNMEGPTALQEVGHNYSRGVETKARDFSEPRVFLHLSRFVSDTRPYFLVPEMKSFMEAFKTNPFINPQQGLASSNFDITKFDVNSVLSTDDVGVVTDVALTSGSVDKFMNDPRIQEIKERIAKVSQFDASMGHSTTQTSFLESISSYFLPAKRSIMKMYHVPYLLQNSLVIQEKTFLPDTRNLPFANAWLRNRESAVTQHENLMSLASPAPSGDKFPQFLFSEIRKETELEDKIYPTPLAKIYNQKLDGVTIVYVPGIYNGIFDKEIFSLGLQALKDELGLRVIQPPVESTCSAEINGQIILNYIYQDMKNRVEAHHKTPRYLFLSYSKGAVDTLHFFTKYPGFVSNYVVGLMAIAAPLQGASIVDKSNLPFEAVAALSESKGPAICQTEKTAAKSINPAALSSFWRKNERMLIGLTRYYSVSFVSNPEDSHLFMRATKLMGQFDEDNDGVVTLASSRFPEKLKALDLGIVQADHLAGILSSNFNQKSFMKSLITTVAELNGADRDNNFKWNSQIITRAASPGHYYWNLLSLKNLNYSNSWELNRLLLPPVTDPADNYEVKIHLPSSQFLFDPAAVLDVQKMPDIMSKTSVSPATPKNMPQGILIDYHHHNMVHFRMDHQFNYESRSPVGIDDNKNFGFMPASFEGESDWVQMQSKNNSIRMTTMAYRFSPLDFPKMKLRIAVTKEVEGADPVIGKTGKDDSAFQFWFTIRVGNATGDRARLDASRDQVILFGYYWGSNIPGETRKAGEIFENWYSNKYVYITTLPEAKQLLLNNPEDLGKPQTYQRNLAEDLKRAFPNLRVEDMDILSITFQHDSNDTGTESEAYFKSLSFTP